VLHKFQLCVHGDPYGLEHPTESCVEIDGRLMNLIAFLDMSIEVKKGGYIKQS